MQSITTIGLDIAKSVFQVHGVGAGGQVVVRRQLKRRHVLAFFQKLPPCLVGIEACASSHYLVARTPGARSYRSAHAAGLCEALCQMAEGRYG
jgi:transposase